jgi:hypothetical protein
LFTADAVSLIYRASEGIPRLINNICDNALLTGFAMDARPITAEIIAEVAQSLDLLQPMIEDDPRQVMEASLPPLPIMREESDPLFSQPQNEPLQLKVVSSREEKGDDDFEDDIEDNLRAG